MSLFQAKN